MIIILHMMRTAPRRRVLLVVVIALIGLMSAPIDECDDYAFFRFGAAPAQAQVSGADPVGSVQLHPCSCLVCAPTTDDAFLPRLLTPQRGEVVAAVAADLQISVFLSGVYHPPNA